MPRPKRTDAAGGIYHALNRGNARSAFFRKDVDYEAYRFTILMLGAVLACSGIGCGHYGQRHLAARIEHDGQSVLTAHFGVPDNWDQRAAWRRLETQVFEEVEPKMLGADSVGRATLKGRIRITLTHAGRAWAAVEVDEIQLPKHDAGSHTWRLAPGEVDRTSKALGPQK